VGRCWGGGGRGGFEEGVGKLRAEAAVGVAWRP